MMWDDDEERLDPWEMLLSTMAQVSDLQEQNNQMRVALRNHQQIINQLLKQNQMLSGQAAEFIDYVSREFENIRSKQKV